MDAVKYAGNGMAVGDVRKALRSKDVRAVFVVVRVDSRSYPNLIETRVSKRQALQMLEKLNREWPIIARQTERRLYIGG